MSAKVAEKSKCIDTSTDDEEPSLPDDVAEVRQIASVLQLPSQTRSTIHHRSRHNLEELQKVADAMKPNNTKRNACDIEIFNFRARDCRVTP